jgi:hypothetical protein
VVVREPLLTEHERLVDDREREEQAPSERQSVEPGGDPGAVEHEPEVHEPGDDHHRQDAPAGRERLDGSELRGAGEQDDGAEQRGGRRQPGGGTRRTDCEAERYEGRRERGGVADRGAHRADGVR